MICKNFIYALSNGASFMESKSPIQGIFLPKSSKLTPPKLHFSRLSVAGAGLGAAGWLLQTDSGAAHQHHGRRPECRPLPDRGLSPLLPVRRAHCAQGVVPVPCIFGGCPLPWCPLQPALHTAASLAHPCQIIPLLSYYPPVLPSHPEQKSRSFPRPIH